MLQCDEDCSNTQGRIVPLAAEYGFLLPGTSGPRHDSDDAADATLLPSQRSFIPPLPGTEDAAFLENLNDIYGVEDTADVPLIDAIRQHMNSTLLVARTRQVQGRAKK